MHAARALEFGSGIQDPGSVECSAGAGRHCCIGAHAHGLMPSSYSSRRERHSDFCPELRNYTMC